MKYDEIEDKKLFKNWLGITKLNIGENVELEFCDRECYNTLFELFCTSEDEQLNKNSSDMEIILTHETFENIIDEYDLALDMRNSLIVLN